MGERLAAHRGANYPNVTKMVQKTNDNACESDYPVIPRGKVSSHDRTGDRYANQCRPFGQAGVQDVAEYRVFGSGHELAAISFRLS